MRTPRSQSFTRSALLPFWRSSNRRSQLGTGTHPPRAWSAECLEPRYALDSTVVFNELMYNALGDDAGQEWIELHNQMSVDVDVSGWRLDGGVQYDFPEGTVVPGRGYLVVAADPAALKNATKLETVLGPWTGSLANGGERVSLYNNYASARTRPTTGEPVELPVFALHEDPLFGRRQMDTLRYEDRGEWPSAADGTGASLAKRDPNAGSASAAHWTHSPQLGGTPGQLNFAGTAPQFLSSLSDASVHGNDGKPLGVLSSADGFAGRAGDFDGVSSHVALPLDISPSALPQLTLGAWIRPDDATPSHAVISGDDGGFDRTIGIGSGAIYTSPNGPNIWNAFNVNGHDATSVDPQMTLVDRDGNATNVSLTIDGRVSGFTNARNATIALTNDYAFVNAGNSSPTATWHLDGLVPGRAYDLYLYGGVARDVGVRVDHQGNGSLTDDELQLAANTGRKWTSVVASDTGRLLGDIAPGSVSEGNWSGLQLQDTVTGTLWSVDIQAINGPVGGQGVPILQSGPLPTAPGSGYSAFVGGKQLSGSGEAVRPGVWAFLAASYDQASNSMTFYLDTDARSTNDPLLTFTESATAFGNSRLPANLGRTPTGQWYFNGLMDNAFFIRETLNQAAVESIRQSGVTALSAYGENLLGIYTFDDPISDTQPLNLPTLSINEITSATADPFQVELVNRGTEPAKVGGLVLATSDPSLERFTLPEATLAPGAVVSFATPQLGFRPQLDDNLILYDRNRSFVIDAVHVESAHQARVPHASGEWQNATRLTIGSSNPSSVATEDVVVNEIFYHGYPNRDGVYQESNEEWIELFNRSSATIDLSGWQLTGGVEFTFAPGTQLAAQSYLVVTRDVAALVARHPELATKTVGPWQGQLADRGERIELRDARNNLADLVDYFDSGRWPSEADGGGSSLELIDAFADNRVAESWAASDETGDMPWSTYTYRGVTVNDRIGNNIFHELVLGMLDAGEMLLDDIQVVQDPDTPEAISLMQNATFTDDPLGAAPSKWRVLGNHSATVALDPLDPSNRVLHLRSSGSTDDKHNHLESTFANGQKTVLGKTYEISFRAKWLSGSNQLNSRLYFNYLQRTTLVAATPDSGTPGRVNSRARASVGPTFTEMQHQPVVPQPHEPVDVSVIAQDPQGIRNLQLHYAVGDGPFQRVAMSDRGGGRFVGQIPPQAAASVVQFYVEGTDGNGATSYFPAAGANSRALYVVDDQQAAIGVLHNLRILMAPRDREAMYVNTERMSNAFRGATVIYGEREVFYDVGVRLKGSAFGRYAGTETGFSLSFHPDQPFRGVHTSVAIERAGNKKEILAKHMLGRAGGGLASYYDDVIRLIAPRPTETGTALLSMARYGDVFLEETFGDNSGPLYNMELLYNPNGTIDGKPESLKLNNPYNHNNGSLLIADQGTDKETYRWNFQMRNARSRDDYGPMIQLAQAFSLTGAALETATNAIMDVDQWMRTWAMLSLNGNDDIYTRVFDHNFRMYVRPDDGKIVALPWDLDRAFQLAVRAPLWGDENLRKVIELPVNRRLFFGHAQDLIDSTVNNTYMADWASHYGSLVGQNLNAELSFINSRSNYVLSQLPAEIPFELKTAGPLDVGAQSTAVLSGRAWINVRQIRIAHTGQPLDVRWNVATPEGTTPGGIWADGWQIELPVDRSREEYVLEAFDFQGRKVGSATIQIRSTASSVIANQLRVTEIMYHAADPDDRTEYVELTNLGPAAIPSVAGVRFNEGIRSILRDEPLAPNERVVVVRDEQAFRTAYGNGPRIVGTFSDSALDNGGERLTLADRDGSIIQSFVYNDAWYPVTDGGGVSLELLLPYPGTTEAWNDPLAWVGGAQIGGTPGGSPPVPGDANLDGRFDSADLVRLFQIGEYEDAIAQNSTWADGDWNGDREFNSRDFVFAMTLGTYATEAIALAVETKDTWSPIDAAFALLSRDVVVPGVRSIF